MNKIILLCLSLLLMIDMMCPAYSTNEKLKWLLVKHEADIKVYVAELDNSEIIKVRCNTDVKSSMAAVQAVLENIEARREWVPYLISSHLIKRVSRSETLEYSLFSAPWPVSDRDFVYRVRIIDNSVNERVYKIHSEVSQLMPETENNVRAQLYESIYTLTAVDEELTRVSLVFHADLRGWVPDWVVNMVQKILPYKILRNLKSRLVELE